MLKYKTKKIIDCADWDNLVRDTYKRPYSYMEQDFSKHLGSFDIKIPCDIIYDNNYHDSIPEKLRSSKKGVKFKTWLERDPKAPVGELTDEWNIRLFWLRNFYPDIYTVANDLYKKGLIEAGEYTIQIDLY